MNQNQQQIHDMFDAYKHSYDFKDSLMMDIMSRRAEFEKRLNDMWRIYTSGNMRQVVEYKKQVQSIKDAGLVVMRNKAGDHKIAFKN